MEPKDSRKTLAANLEALSVRRFGKLNKTQMAATAKLGMGQVQRALEGGPLEMATLEKLAVWGQVEPWRLLAPDLGANVGAAHQNREEAIKTAVDSAIRETIASMASALASAAQPSDAWVKVERRRSDPTAPEPLIVHNRRRGDKAA